MANIYVRSGAAGAATGADWANAYLTLKAAVDKPATSADTIWVADDHAESTTGAQVQYTYPATVGLKVLCANTHVTEPPTGLATSATVTVTGNLGFQWLLGFGYTYGISFFAGTGNSGAADITFAATAGQPASLIFENCNFSIVSTNAGADYIIAASGTAGKRVVFKGCSFSMGAAGQAIQLGVADQYFENCTLAAGTAPTNVFEVISTANHPKALISGCDFSGVAYTNLISVATTVSSQIIIRNCKLRASTNLTTANVAVMGSRFEAHNCNSGDTNYSIRVEDSLGLLTDETTIVRTGGASNGTTPLAWKVVTQAAANVLNPWISPEISIWNESIGSALTATIEIIHDSVTNLTDAEVWLEVEYMGTSGVPKTTVGSDGLATAITTPADQTISSETWTTTGLTNPNKQKLSVSFTPQEKGVVLVRVIVGKASKTLYIDPKLTIA